MNSAIDEIWATMPLDTVAIAFNTQAWSITQVPDLPGRGGTNFQAIENYIEDVFGDGYPDKVVVITDGEAPLPKVSHPDRWVYVLTEVPGWVAQQGLSRDMIDIKDFKWEDILPQRKEKIMQYSLVGTEDGSNLTVFVQGSAPLVAHSTHPNYERILEGVLAGDESVLPLFDITQLAGQKFERLSERVTVANGHIYFDGDEVHDVIGEHIVRFIEAGEDFQPLVNFLENLYQNPNEHSREQLYRWLDARDFTITEDGLIVGYKGVAVAEDGGYVSINRGRAIVDGEVREGAIPNDIGAIIEMPRTEVTHDPAIGCHQGLHVGTYDYANNFGQGALLEVHVNPRDVVSVPTDSGDSKMRVCRYEVIDTIEQEYTAPVRRDYWDDNNYEDDFYLDEDEESYEDSYEEEVEELEDTPDEPVGVTFKDRDSRRQGRTFVVEAVEGDYAVGKSLPQNVTRKVRLDRLYSRKYERVS
jgi:hypothetical protein